MTLFGTVSGIIIAFVVNWKVSIVTMSSYPVWFIITICLALIVQKGSEKQKSVYEKLGGIGEEVLYHIKTIASFGNFGYENKRFENNLKLSLNAGLRRAVLSAISSGAFMFVTLATYMICFGYGSSLIYNKEMSSTGDKLLNAGEIYIAFVIMIFSAIVLQDTFPNLKSVIEGCNASKNFFQLEDSIKVQKQSKYLASVEQIKPDINTIKGKIEFMHVTFSYPKKPNEKRLENFSVVFEEGKTTAIVGESGCGKSTIVNLIERLYDISEGAILIDDFNINQINLEYYRSFIGYVAQDPVLFNDTIRNNIVFGREAISEGDIIEACKKAQIFRFIKKVEGGLDYMVGIKGSQLSGGQKQRIAIARAIVAHPKILILDEATSALDNKNEKKVQKAINSIRGDITIIIIAHRLSTIKDADNIIVLGKNGFIEELGNHKTLLQLNGFYFQLVSSQLGKQENNLEIITDQIIVNEEDSPSSHVVSTCSSCENIPMSNKEKRKDQEKKSEPKKEELEKLQKSNVKKIFSLLSNYKGLTSLAIIFSIIIGAEFPIVGYLFGHGIDSLSNPDLEIVKREGIMHVYYFLILSFGIGIAEFFKIYSFEAIGEHLTTTFREQIFAKFLRFHMSFFDIHENSPGNLISEMSSNTSCINNIVLSIIGVYAQAIATIIVSVIMAFIADWRISLINLCLVPIIICSSAIYYKFIEDNEEPTNTTQAGGILSECICNTLTIFSFNAQPKVGSMFQKAIVQTEVDLKKKSIINGCFCGFSNGCYFLCYAAIFYSGGSFIINDTGNLQNILEAFYTILFGSYMIGLAQKYATDIAKAKEALNKIFKLLDEKTLIDPLEDNPELVKPKLTEFKGKIEFREVVFAYPTNLVQKVFDGISFIIQPGQNVAFVGSSGSGKSTIVQLIERFYDVTSGMILIDDIDIKKYDIVALRKLISMVGQEPALFKRSVYDNIKYGKLEATKEEIELAAEHAKIREKLAFTVSDKAEDGNSACPISGGEKQRVAIARALIRNPKILLLDEATSALDTNTEHEIQKYLDEKSKGLTTIFIAHRLSTITNCDVIFVLEKGKILESGSHDQLYEKRGHYFNMLKVGK